jgi:hypothetical protein
MFFAVLLVLSAAPDLAELKLSRAQSESMIVYSLVNGLTEAPLKRYETRYKIEDLDAAARASLTTQALTQVKQYLESPQGRENWGKYLTYGHDTVVARSASLAADFAYWSTIAREKKVKEPSDTLGLERATQNLAAFKKDRARLEREEATREKAAKQPDDAAFKTQLTERLTYFLNETKALPFDAKLEEASNGRKRFADKTLEAKPKWWKFCFRAGPEATKAAREFATAWLAELNAAPSPARLSDEK